MNSLRLRAATLTPKFLLLDRCSSHWLIGISEFRALPYEQA
ncbi:MAG TPA: hypothetical protein V6D11_20880 [Waterburya sp.]